MTLRGLLTFDRIKFSLLTNFDYCSIFCLSVLLIYRGLNKSCHCLMGKRALLGRISFAPVKVERSKDEVKSLATQILTRLKTELSDTSPVKPATVNAALKIAFEAGDFGMTGLKNEITTKLRVKQFIDDLDSRERARRKGNLFMAYCGDSQSVLLQNHPRGQSLQRYLARMIYDGREKQIALKRLHRKVKYGLPGLNNRAKSELLKEAIAVVEQHPFLNRKITLSTETMRMTALHWKDHQLRGDLKLQKQLDEAINGAKRQIIELATAARRGYIVDKREIVKVRLRLWKGKRFKAGVRSLPGSNMLIALFNGFCTGIHEFLAITNTPGRLSMAEKLRKKGRDDDANYLRAAAIYLRHGEIGKAVGLHSEVYARRPLFTTSGDIIDQTSASDTIGRMISTFRKWENRVQVNWDQV